MIKNSQARGATSLPSVRLLHFPISHFNEKVCWALDYKRWPHHREALVPGFHVPRVRRLTGQTKVPILQLDGRWLVGSNHILAELERRCPAPALYPVDPKNRQRALEIQAYFDESVAPDLRRLFWSTYFDRPAACAKMALNGFSPLKRGLWRCAFPLMRPMFRRNIGLDRKAVQAARKNLGPILDRLESIIGPSGYLVGNQFSVADLAAAAVMTAIIRPSQFPYPLPEPWPAALVDLRGSISERAGFRWVVDIYARHRGKSAELRG